MLLQIMHFLWKRILFAYESSLRIVKHKNCLHDKMQAIFEKSVTYPATDTFRKASAIVL